MKSNRMAEIISIGDELLAGLTVNSNAAFIAAGLAEKGISVDSILTVPDDEDSISGALAAAIQRVRIVIMTGGLGPTHDDMTMKTAARFFSSSIRFDASVFEDIKQCLRKRGRDVSNLVRDQAMVPADAEILKNEIGTAPGLLFTRDDRVVYILPGVPAEMERMFTKYVLPGLVGRAGADFTRSVILRTVNIPESKLYERVVAAIERFPDVRMAFLPQPSGVNIRLTVTDSTEAKGSRRLHEAEAAVRKDAGEVIYGTGEETLESVVVRILIEKQLTIAVAESCTGGLVSHKLTNVPGSSAVFDRGIITYSNAAKQAHLTVSAETLKDYGAVSAETAAAMAGGIRRVSGSDIGLSTTGIAGPGGGTAEKPVGTVYVGYADEEKTVTRCHRFYRDRLFNKERFSNAALDLLRLQLIP